MSSLEKFYKNRNRRLLKRGLPIFRLDAGSIHNNNTNNGGDEGGGDGGKEGGHGNTRLPYGIAKSMGLDTTGMTPSEVWAMLKGEGVSPEEEYKKLEERGKGGGSEPAPEPAPEPPKPPKTDFTTKGGRTIDDLEITDTGSWRTSDKYSLSGTAADGYKETPLYAATKDDLLYALKEAGVTSVKIDGETVNPQEKDYPEPLFKIEKDYYSPTVSHVVGIEYGDDGRVMLKGLGDSYVMGYGGYESIDYVRQQILNLSKNAVDIATSDLMPQEIRDYFKAKEEISGITYTDTYRGRTYTDLHIRPDGDEYLLRGTYGDVGVIRIQSFPTREDLLIFAKENGITGLADPYAREIFKPAEMELPKFIGYVKASGKHLSKVTISKSGDSYVIKGTDLSGKTKKLSESATFGACVETATLIYGVKESDLTVSAKTRKAAAADDAWKTSNKVEYYTTYLGTRVGSLKGMLSPHGAFRLEGKSEDGEAKTMSFGSEKAALFWLKGKGVERFKYVDSAGVEKTAHPTKEKFPEDTIYMDREIYTGVKIDYAGTSYSGRPLYKITGIGPDGAETTIVSRVYSLEDTHGYFHDWDKDSAHVTITDDAKNAEEVARKEKEEKERIERERREAEERARREEEERKAAFRARESEMLAKDPDKYHVAGNAGHVYSDVKVIESDGTTRMVGIDIDGKAHTLDSSYGDRSSEYLAEALRRGFKDVQTEKSKRFTIEDAYGYTVTASDFKIVKRHSGGYAIEMSKGHGFFGLSTEEEAEQKLKELGVDSYYKSDGTVVGAPTKKWGTPVDGMHDAIIRKGKDGKYTVSAHSDKAGGTATVYTGSSAEECKNWLESQNVDPFDVPVVTPNPNDDIVRIHSEVSLKNFDTHRAKRVGKSFISKMTEEDKNECAEMLTELFKTQTYRMVRSTSSFSKIVANGFLSQMETGTGGSGAAVNRSGRKEASETYFGEKKSTADHDYEKYGCLNSENDEDMNWVGYGGSSPVMYTYKKDRVKDRVTYTMGDSLNTRHHAASAGYAGDNPTIEGITSSSESNMKKWLKEYRRYKKGEISAHELHEKVRQTLNNSYIELQYHGELTIADVEKVSFRSEKDIENAFKRLSSEERKATIKKCKENGVKMVYKVSGGKYSGDVYEWLKTKYPEDYTE